MRKRISKYKHLHSNRFRYLSSSIPLICASGLLLVCGMMINPVNNISEKAHAASVVTGGATTGGSGNTGTTTTPASVSMVFDENTAPNEQVDVVAGTPVASDAKYFTITPSGSVEKYSIYVQTSSSSNGSLVASNTNNNATIATLADKTTGVPLSSLSTNTWGYALSTGRQTTSSMLYKGLSGSTNAISAYDSAANPTTAQDFTLAFAANIGNDKPADHYIANVLVSVAANPGEVTSGFRGLEFMQELTNVECYRAEVGQTGQLIDMRDNKSYWVTKLKDGNCWMTQNLDYDDPDSKKVTDANLNQWYSSSTSGYFYDPGEKIVQDGKLVEISSGQQNQQFIGNYYNYPSVTKGSKNDETHGNAALSICPTGWLLPTGGNFQGSFWDLLSGIDGSSLQLEPYHLVLGGTFASSLSNVGDSGYYWTSTASNCSGPSCAYGMRFDQAAGMNTSPYAPSRSSGLSVRCLVQGS